jgi:Kef-type K+ transport system membrane component KefB
MFGWTIIEHPLLVAGIISGLLLAKYFAAWLASRAFGYSIIERKLMWSLTLPQVAATLAAAVVAFNTFDPIGRRLIDEPILNAVLVLVIVTAIGGTVLTGYYAERLLLVSEQDNDQKLT